MTGRAPRFIVDSDRSDLAADREYRQSLTPARSLHRGRSNLQGSKPHVIMTNELTSKFDIKMYEFLTSATEVRHDSRWMISVDADNGVS
jgi:hypothetical protein